MRSLVTSIFLYACEAELQRRIQAMEMRCYRKILRISYNVHVTNEEVRAKIQVPASSPSRGGDVTVYVCDINHPSLPTPFYSVLVSISVLMAISTVFHSIKTLRFLTLFFRSYFCHTGTFNYISLYESLPHSRCDHLWLTGLKAPTY